ncbi:hypothetical protein N9M39_01065, partial [Halieaceae bacterium]|nr:hypothetical protein [Halieaceae bacterium]
LWNSTGAGVRIEASRCRTRLLLLFYCLPLSALGVLLHQGHAGLALCLAPLLALGLWGQWPQPWLDCELSWAADGWVWRTPEGVWPVRVRRNNLSLPLLTWLELEALDTAARWQISLFHDSGPASALRGLRRRVRVQG